MTFLYDIINLEFVIAISFLAVAYNLRSEPFKVLLLFGHILVIFLLNDVMFSPSYFGDQLRQLDAAKTIRNSWLGTLEAFGQHGSKMGFASLIYAVTPFPFMHSVQSLAMVNFLLFLTIFMLLRKFGLSNQKVDYFFLIFPSLLLYSSLALRDMLVLFFLFISINLFLTRDRTLFSMFIALPLIVLKFQNYLMLIGGLILYIYLRKANKWRYLLLGSFILLAAFIPERIPIVAQLYETLERWRLALFHDQYMYNWEYIREMNIESLYEPLGTGLVLIYQIAKNFTYMLLKPLPWECENPFQVIQSAENIVIFVMIIWVNRKRVVNEKIKQKILFLNCLLFVSMSINGLVVFNFGSAVRYKFPFIVIYFIYFFYLLRSDELFVKQIKAIRHKHSTDRLTLAPG